MEGTPLSDSFLPPLSFSPLLRQVVLLCEGTLVRRRQSVLLVLVEWTPCPGLRNTLCLVLVGWTPCPRLRDTPCLVLSLSTGHLVQGSGTILVSPCLSCIHRTMGRVLCPQLGEHPLCLLGVLGDWRLLLLLLLQPLLEVLRLLDDGRQGGGSSRDSEVSYSSSCSISSSSSFSCSCYSSYSTSSSSSPSCSCFSSYSSFCSSYLQSLLLLML